ncbi:hypothetical protein [Mycolicibacterium sp. F2034L]|uniref:hypothetical protein n=1 Tax=Mycolicibacterium sp. F2034L TaxID=2926422 RepID=UPI001FF25F9B|nr:hypothetical protein [Mycolicibacterium sp. F2034L]MCK0173858.1 hypothetical protein [Mycolicibacterium sp. F2034L]
MHFFKRKRRDPAITDAKVYYSTPFGDTRDGGQKLFLLERKGVKFLPVFHSVESMKEFYERMDRAAFMILEGSIQSVTEMNRSIEQMKAVGIVVEPLSENPVEIMPGP